MKTFLLSFLIYAGCSLPLTAQQIKPAIPSDPEIEAKINKLLQKLTLEEKIGQMCEITIDVITDFSDKENGFRLSESMLDTVIGKYKVGSILNTPFSIAQEKEVWADLITRIQKKSMEEIWHHLHSRRNFLSSKHQHGCRLQPATHAAWS